jgi:hypothetical protein
MRKPRCAATLGHRGCNDDTATTIVFVNFITMARAKPKSGRPGIPSRRPPL